jgi:serine/threonine protein phosphatase PrpC
VSVLHLAAATHTGLVRLRNEDSYGFTGFSDAEANGEVISRTVRKKGCLVVVADGLGGHPCGHVASRIAVRSLLDSAPGSSSELIQGVHTANRHVVEGTFEDSRLIGMGTTIAAVLFLQEGIAVVNVGDSSVFEFAAGHLEKLSIDDIPNNSGGSRGMPTSIVTQTLGGGRTLTAVTPHLFEDRLTGSRQFLVCSDGLTNFVHRGEIVTILREASGADAVYALIERTLEAGAPDNVTVVIAEVEDETLEEG